MEGEAELGAKGEEQTHVTDRADGLDGAVVVVPGREDGVLVVAETGDREGLLINNLLGSEFLGRET